MHDIIFYQNNELDYLIIGTIKIVLILIVGFAFLFNSNSIISENIGSIIKEKKLKKKLKMNLMKKRRKLKKLNYFRKINIIVTKN